MDRKNREISNSPPRKKQKTEEEKITEAQSNQPITTLLEPIEYKKFFHNLKKFEISYRLKVKVEK